MEDGGGSDSISRVNSYTKAYWPFEESTGTTAYDQTAYSYDMSLISAVRVSDGKFGRGIDFEHESDSYLRDYYIVRGDTWDDFTLEAWVKQESLPDGYNSYIASSYTPFRFWLYLDSSGAVNFDFDRYIIKSEFETNLQEIAAYLQENNNRTRQ